MEKAKGEASGQFSSVRQDALKDEPVVSFAYPLDRTCYLT
jgi:hypothetical protein